MTSPVAILRRHPAAVLLSPAQERDRTIRRRVSAAWGLLYLNTMTFVPGLSLLHLPGKAGKGLAQAALPLAIMVALTVNSKIKIRPNIYLLLVGLLAVGAVITMPEGGVGTVYRTLRFIGFVACLWLLTPFWGRRDMLILRCHLRWLYVALATVLLGLFIAPGKSFAFDGRLTGIVWPMLPTQIAQYAGIATGITLVLWLARLISGKAALAGVAAAILILLLSHTRTALVGLVAGILAAGLSLFINSARTRRFFATGAVAVSIAVLTVASVITTYLARGENAEGLATLTGRTNFWAQVLTTPRTRFQEIFGFGLSNTSINGLPIDSNWLAAYMQEGLFGVAVCAIIMLFLFAAAFFQPPGVRRAIALFILTYCLLASYTEVAFTNVSTYMLDITVAASLLVTTGRSVAQERDEDQAGLEIAKR